LRLEKLKWVSQRAKQEREYSEALSKHERAKAQILRTQMDQATAQIELIEEQLRRLRITAPFEGYVVSGDLSQSLGAPVERGNVLFEIAPLNKYRVILKVDERDISDIREAQTGRLMLSAEPDVAHRIRVAKITPISTAEEGRNYFRVEATIDGGVPAGLRPGMKGVGKIVIDDRRYAWIWTHRIVHWAKMLAWSWWP
jgi:multidrug resistance efflux pump